MGGAGSPHERWLNRRVGGKYTIESVLGEGGFGAVYRATQHPIGSEVAIKVLHSEELGQQEDAVQRFLREAESISQLSSPHTIRLHDFGQTEDGELYMVLELAQGEPLSQLLRRENKLSPERVVNIAAQICDSLAESHELGIVHRDLKPANIMVADRDGEDFVKVLDFGVAKVLVPDDEGFKTRTGVICGTPSYLSPEQAKADGIGPASDLYSLGAVMFRALAGRRVFEDQNAMKIIMAHLRQPPPELRKLAPEVPAELAAVVMALLQKDPSDRPASADALSERLRAIDLSPRSAAAFADAQTVKRDLIDFTRVERPAPAPRAEPRPEPVAEAEAADESGDWGAFESAASNVHVDPELLAVSEPVAPIDPQEEERTRAMLGGLDASLDAIIERPSSHTGTLILIGILVTAAAVALYLWSVAG